MILGGGLAGLAAAVRLAERGARVMLVETSPRLGGRAGSHVDPASGQKIDNCQHVLLGCCTNLCDLYARLGVADRIDWHSDLHFFDKQGRHDVMAAYWPPAPLHLGGAMWRFRTLTAGEKWAISRAMAAMTCIGRERRSQLNGMSFAQWLADHTQPRGAVDKFWTVVVVSALNQVPERCAADYAIQVFQEAFLAHRRGYLMGTSAVPLGALYEPAVAIIERAGGRVLTGESVRAIRFDGRRITAVQLDDRELSAPACISALPFDRLEKLVDAPLRQADARLRCLDRFTHSPILGIHLWYRGRAMDHPHMIFVDSPLQWVFNKGVIDDADSELRGCQYLHGVISAADEFVDQPADRLLDLARSELAAYLPRTLPGLELARGKIIKEKRATFSPEPGIERFRPPACGAIPNLYLAGDWTATGWPATMEGAVRSGYKAAAALLDDDTDGLAPDLPPAALFRWAGALSPRG
jgi:zeta-carotene desaturase